MRQRLVGVLHHENLHNTKQRDSGQVRQFIGSVYANDYNTLSFIAHFSVELEKRNFPYICGRDAVIADISHYFWEGDHEIGENINISVFRLVVTNS